MLIGLHTKWKAEFCLNQATGYWHQDGKLEDRLRVGGRIGYRIMSGREQSKKLTVALEVLYKSPLSESDGGSIGKEVANEFSRLGFTVISRSRFGLVVVADVTVVQRVLKTRIEFETVLVKGGFSGQIELNQPSFQVPPVIPESLVRIVDSLRLTPPIIPL